MTETPKPTWQAVNAYLHRYRRFLMHRPTCAADQFEAQGCDCGLRDWVTTLVRQEEPAAKGTPMNLQLRIGRGGHGGVVVYDAKIHSSPLASNTIASFYGGPNQTLEQAIERARVLVQALSER